MGRTKRCSIKVRLSAHTSFYFRVIIIMNAVVVVFTFCFAGAFAGLLSREQPLPDTNVTKECLKEHGIDFDRTSDVPLTDDELYCIPACMYRASGIMKPDGTIDTLKAESFFGPGDDEEREVFFSVYDACYEDKIHCNLVRCMFGELKKHFPSASESNTISKQFFPDLA